MEAPDEPTNRISLDADDLRMEVASPTIESADALWTRAAVHLIEEYDSHGAEQRGKSEAASHFYAAALGALARHYKGEDPAPQEGTYRIAEIVRQMLEELESNGLL